MDEVDLDAPVEHPTATREVPRLRRAAGLAAAGLVLLACQQVLGPMANAWLFYGSSPVDDASQTTFVVLFFGVFVVGLVLLVVGIVRFAAHVHVLAELALRQSAAAQTPPRPDAG